MFFVVKLHEWRMAVIVYHHFIHRGPGQRAGRTYSVWMQQDLFDKWVVVRVHGGRSRAAQQIVTMVVSQEAGERLVRRICGIRAQHGYTKFTKATF